MIGPWGWAARLINDDVAIATATMLGCEFVRWEWPFILPDGYAGAPEYVPKADYARVWLTLKKLQVVEDGRVTFM